MFARRILIIICAVTLMVATIGSVAAQKQKPPEGGKPKPFTLPEREVYKLPNGMQVTLVPYGDIPKVALSLVVKAGNIDEPADQIGLADMVSEYLKEGTTKLSAEAIAETAARMGGSVNIGTDADGTNISADGLSEFTGDWVQLLADIVQTPVFPESALANLKNNHLRNLAISKTRSRTLAYEKFAKLLYPDHAYGRVSPTEQMIQNYKIEDIKNFYKSNFGAQRAHIYIVGQFDKSAVKKVIAQSFEKWEKGPAPKIDIPKSVGKRVINVIDRPGAVQSTLYIGLPVVDPSNPDYISLIVTNTLLGGSFGSRITTNIREQKGYTYSPTSLVSVRYRNAFWAEVADVTTAVTGPAIKEILYEVDRLEKEPVSEEELLGIKNYMAGTFVLRNSSRQGVMGQLIFLDLHNLDEKYLTNYVANIYAVTPQQIQDTVKKYIRPENMFIVIAGDRAKIAEQLKPFGEINN